ncbi:peptidoglycan/xylan/chitin deacetylase (PgdA/CDA1 family) [Bradyrhizobium sp. URHC0002]
MLDSKALASIPLIPANTAPPAPDYPWPKPYTSAMFLSFDVDAESAWTSKDAAHAQRLITMSYGGYEARVGTPKLLELLDQLDLKATFFVTGWSVDAHPAMAEAILKAGHEIGHHGYHHLLPDPGDPWIEEELERGFRGAEAPAWRQADRLSGALRRIYRRSARGAGPPRLRLHLVIS